jgi:hypothetical protein
MGASGGLTLISSGLSGPLDLAVFNRGADHFFTEMRIFVSDEHMDSVTLKPIAKSWNVIKFFQFTRACRQLSQITEAER